MRVRSLFAAAAVVVSALAFAVPANAATTVASPIPATEINVPAYGPHWVLNNFQDRRVRNNLVTVFNDLGEARTWFTVAPVDVTVPSVVHNVGLEGFEVVTIRNDKGQYLSQWNNQNPAVNDWRARWNWVNGDVKNVPAAQWVVVTSAESNNVSLIEVSSLGNTDGPYALTVAQGNGVKETNGVPAWSDLVVLPYSSTDKFQQFKFITATLLS